MATDLKRVQLLLDPELTTRLQAEARQLGLSVSELAGTLLSRCLSSYVEGASQLARIRKLRSSLPAMPDSTLEIRRSRDEGW